MKQIDVFELKNALSDPELGELARLRMQLFRAYPYLYEGEMRYEQAYLAKFQQAKTTLLVKALLNEQVVGMVAGLCMADESAEIKAPWEAVGANLSSIFYLSEILLKPEYRQKGSGQKLMKIFIDNVREQNLYEKVVLCHVERPLNHPLKPNNYRPLDRFWRAAGFDVCSKMPPCWIEWQDVNDTQESPKPLFFWSRDI